MRLALYARHPTPAVADVIERIQSLLPKAGFVFHERLKPLAQQAPLFAHSEELASLSPELLLSIGGDGTLLDTVPLVRASQIPVLGVNLGKLGFLAGVSPDELPAAAREIAEGTYAIHRRMMLEVANGAGPFTDPVALNDVVVKDARPNALIAVKVMVDDDVLGIYHGDGVIVGTPTGSTAYSLSCGGGIVYPHTELIQITPIAAHNLTLRPVVLPASVTIRLFITSRSNAYILNLDNRQAELPARHAITIRRAHATFPLATLSSWDYLTTLREKLHWASERREF